MEQLSFFDTDKRLAAISATVAWAPLSSISRQRNA